MKRKIFIHQPKWRTLFLMLAWLFCIPLTHAEWDDSNFSVSWDSSRGCYAVKLCYIQNYGSGVGDKKEGFRDQEGGVDIFLDDLRMGTIAVDEDKSDKVLLTNELPYVATSESYKEYEDKDHERWKRYVYIYIPIRNLGMHTVKIEGVWWRWGVGWADQDITKEKNCDSKLTISPIKVDGGNYRNSTGKYYQIFWSCENSATDDKYTSVKLRDNFTREYLDSLDGSKSKGTFLLDIDKRDIDLNDVGRYSVVRVYEKSSLKLYNSVEHIRPAYPQPIDDISLLTNTQTRELTVSCQLSSGPANNFCNDSIRMQLKRISHDSKDELAVLTKKVAYEKGKSSYSAVFQIPEDYDNDYEVKIGRDDVWDNKAWENCRVSRSGEFRLHHYCVMEPKVVLNDDDLSATLTWKYQDEGIWSAGTKLNIYRYANGNSYEDAVLVVDNEADFVEGKKIDASLATCNSYQYKMQMVPGGNYKPHEIVDVEGMVEPINIGGFISMEASKGYYSGFTRLRWSTNGQFDNFVVYRREYDASGMPSNFKKVSKEILNVPGINSYSYDDVECPGSKMVEYYVEGNLNCLSLNKVYHVLSDTITGFRIPRGDVSGRVAYKNGQAVNNVLVRLFANKKEEQGYSVRLDGSADDYLETTKNVLQSNSSYAFQLYICPDSSNTVSSMNCILMQKANYVLGLENGVPYFRVGSECLKAKNPVAINSFTHLTASYSGFDATAMMVVRGAECDTFQQVVKIRPNQEEGKLTVGRSFKGWIDEVRVWNRSLTLDEIDKNYFRKLIGNEEGIIAYYPLDEAVNRSFYDMAYDKNGHMEHHGEMWGNVAFDRTRVPSAEQLAYAAFTDSLGNYLLHDVPYAQSGSAYTLHLYFDGHEFRHGNTTDPVTVVLSDKKDDYTINYVDISSFKLSGHVYYVNSSVPVSEASFEIDGQMAVDSTFKPIKSAEDGSFCLNVPVGHHDIKVYKPGHVFKDGGRLVKTNGGLYNFDKDRSGVEFLDSTKVRIIGKVVGGYREFEKQTGFSLSHNNLSDMMYLDLQLKDKVGDLTTVGNYIDSLTHCNAEYINEVEVNKHRYRIRMNSTTGEFYADVFPEVYDKVQLYVDGRGDVLEEHEPVNLSLATQQDIRYYPAVVEEGQEQMKLVFHKELNFQVQDKPQLMVEEVVLDEIATNSINNSWSPKGFFGNEKESISAFGDNEVICEDVKLYDEKNKENPYLFGKPVYTDDVLYSFRLSGYVPYYYNNDPTSTDVDTVPIRGGKVYIANTFHEATDSVILQSNGVGFYQFRPDNPDIALLTDGVRTLDFTLLANGEEYTSPTIEGYLLGCESYTPDFITTGPSYLMYVLRDPPGTNSSAYISRLNVEAHTKMHILGGYANFEGSVNRLKKVGIKVWGGAGSQTEALDYETNSTLGGDVKVLYDHIYNDGITRTISTSGKVQTSSSPEYVGRNGDILIGQSTNIGVGETNSIGIKSLKNVIADSDDVVKNSGGYVICKNKCLSLGQIDSTLFAYPQVHIERVILPKIDDLISELLERGRNLSDREAILKADQTNMVIYVPHLEKEDAAYGEANPQTALYSESRKCFEGDYYDVFYPSNLLNEMLKNPNSNPCDSIRVQVGMRNEWLRLLSQNEEMKVKAIEEGHGHNMSYQGGAKISVNRTIGTKNENGWDISFDFNPGLSIDEAFEFGSNLATGWKLDLNLAGIFHYGHKKLDSESVRDEGGFTLSDEGGDYMSVDVFNRKNPETSNSKDDDDDDEKEIVGEWVFYLRGGATTNPHEGVEKTKYYKPGTLLSEGSLQVEVPKISVEKAVISNVPSTKPATFEFKMYNESQAHRKAWFTLKLADTDENRGYAFRVLVDGAPLESGRDFLLGEGNVLHKKVEIFRAGDDYDLNNLKFILAAKNQSNALSYNGVIADTITVSAHFVPASTEVSIKEPGNHWVLNRNCEVSDGEFYLPVIVEDFDVNEPNLERIEVQYKPVQESSWKEIRVFYKDSADLKEADNYDEGIKEIIGKQTRLKAKFFGDEDQNYDIRAVSYSKYGMEYVTYISETVTGIKDILSPKLFGHPTPNDHILKVDDDVMFTFNEELDEGRVIHKNFDVRAVMNQARNDREVSVHLNGVGDILRSTFAKDWSGKDLTVEFWMRMGDVENECILFRHGDANSNISLRKLAANKHSVDDHKVDNGVLVVDFPGMAHSLQSRPLTLKEEEWSHVAITLDHLNGKVKLYYNFLFVGEEDMLSTYDGVGKVEMGENFYGDLDELRIWNKALTLAELENRKNQRLSGSESLLLGYYPMDEAKGNMVSDKARGNMMSLVGEWNSAPGYALYFPGNGLLKLDNSSSAVRPQDSYTLEFWFKTDNANGDDATLCSTGKGDGTDTINLSGNLHIGFEQHELVVRSDGQKLVVPGFYDDHLWHHFVLTVNRNFSYAQVYMDGVKRAFANDSCICALNRSQLYFGARNYRTGNLITDCTADRYFKGWIDEIRLWQTSFTEFEVKDNANLTMHGDETGLLAYYPFEEWFENDNKISELIFTLKEQVDKGFGAELSGGVTESMNDHAPLANKGVETPVDFDFAVNKDRVLLTLKEKEEYIDNVVVNFAVKDLKDANGNDMTDIVRWSALVNRNPLQWGEEKKRVEMRQEEDFAFTLPLNNLSGEPKHFDLEGLPSWMRAEPESGIVEANGTLEVKFCIDSRINVGYYDERIFARGDNNVSAVLPIEVKVNGERPDWKVNPNDYEYNLSVFGQMKIGKVFSEDEEDLIGVFSLGRCVGLAHSQYDKNTDTWYTYLTIHTKEKPEEVVDYSREFEFRIWDASTGVIYTATPSAPLVFNQGVCGSRDSLIVFTGNEMRFREMDLAQGWNWVTFGILDEAKPTIDHTLRYGDWTSDDVLKNKDVFCSYSEKQKCWEGIGLNLERNSMYVIHSSTPQRLSFSGTESYAEPVHVKANQWNYMGYIPNCNMDVREAMVGFDAQEGDILKSQDQFAMFSDGIWAGSLKRLEANRGYMLYTTKTDSFCYPKLSTFGRDVRGSVSEYANSSTVKLHYPTSLTMVAYPVYDDAQPGDIIAAYVNGELRGRSELVEVGGKVLHFLSVAGDSERDNVMFHLLRDGKVVAQSAEVMPYYAHSMRGTITAPQTITFDKEMAVEVYPNPFVTYLNVAFFAEEDGEAEITVYDLAGRRVLYKRLKVHEGKNKYTWDGKTDLSLPCASGVHLVRVTVDGNTSVHEVIRK